MKPMKAAFIPQYIASNQADRADNILVGTNEEVIEQLRKDMRDFKQKVDKVILIWTANTEESIPDMDTL